MAPNSNFKYSNDNDPTFGRAQFDFVLDPETPVGSWIGRVGARDADASDGGSANILNPQI